jgi:hypothetical protein
MVTADTGHLVVKFGRQHHLFELLKSAEVGRLSISQSHSSVSPPIGETGRCLKVSWQQTLPLALAALFVARSYDEYLQ